MRKRLLRSRSGFEKPESREEAIMQNILGASNVLEPSESNIEEILKSILYNTPYTKEAEFEIEKILLAIKNNGTYDGEGESRDMKILIAILNDLDYTEGTESRIEELFVEWLHQRSKVNVLEGVPPLTFVAKGNPLINYEISGNTTQSGTPTPESPVMPNGTGERTGNLWVAIKCSYTSLPDSSVWVYSSSLTGSVYRIPCKPNTKYTLYLVGNVSISIWRICEVSTDVVPNATSTSVPTTGAYATAVPASKSATFTTSASAKYILFQTNETAYDSVLPVIMLIEGNTKIPYEPWGVKIPISSANATTPIYLGEVQTTRKIKKLVLTGEETFVATTASIHYRCRTTLVPKGIAQSAVNVLSTHYFASAGARDGAITLTTDGGSIYFTDDTNAVTAETFKAYLAAQYAAGTPVTVWYVQIGRASCRERV